MKSYFSHKDSNLLILGCWIIYVAAYVGRLNYSASLVEIIQALSITEAQAGMVYSAFAITYGVGQFVNGLLCKFYNPKYVITGALTASGLCNLLLPLASDPKLMLLIWLLNGAAQSMLWSLIIRTLSREVPDEKLDRAIITMSSTVAVGTALAFGSSALFVALGDWRITFFVASGILCSAALFWFLLRAKLDKAPRETAVAPAKESEPAASVPEKRAPLGGVFLMALTVICVSAVANGFIKDGVNNWLPKYLKDAFSLPSSVSIILTLLLPLFSILGAFIGRALYRRLRNHTLVCALEYGVASLLLVGILTTRNVAPLAAVMVLFISLACMMASVNNIVTGMFPLDNRDRINSGMLAGALDTLCYVGSAVAGTLLGAMSKGSGGWASVFTLLLVLSAAATVICGVTTLLSMKKSSPKS